MLQNASLLAIVAVHTAENEPSKVGDDEEEDEEAEAVRSWLRGDGAGAPVAKATTAVNVMPLVATEGNFTEARVFSFRVQRGSDFTAVFRRFFFRTDNFQKACGLMTQRAGDLLIQRDTEIAFFFRQHAREGFQL